MKKPGIRRENRYMGISLVDALQHVELEAGRVYECQVGRLREEIRVEEAAPDLLPTPMEASDVMLDPWTDLLSPQPVTYLNVVAVPTLLPDPPDIPTDWRRL